MAARNPVAARLGSVRDRLMTLAAFSLVLAAVLGVGPFAAAGGGSAVAVRSDGPAAGLPGLLLAGLRP
jgi:hypothetical protein